MEIQLEEYDYDAQEYVQVGSVDTYTLAHNLDPEATAGLLEDYVNAGGKRFRAGQRVGRVLHDAHRALQAYVIRWALGLLVGIAEQEAWDPRNARELAIARHVERLHDDYYEGVEPLDDYGIPGE